MKSTLDGLMTSALKPDEVVMYKSDGPLRKLKVLSEHWTAKAKESSERMTMNISEDSIPDVQSLSPTPGCSSSTRIRRPTNKVMPCTRTSLGMQIFVYNYLL